MDLHPEVLSDAQRRVLAPLGAFAVSHGFYLGGGTAVALRLGHRRSVDFDWFRPKDFGDPLLLAQELRAYGPEVVDVEVAAGTLHAVVDGVRTSFLAYPYPLLTNLESQDTPPLSLASLDDLAPMKLVAVAQRGARKDFIDVYALVRQHKPLSDLLTLYQRKYSVSDVAHVLIALTYFDTAEEEPAPTMLWDVSWEAVKRSLEGWVAPLVR